MKKFNLLILCIFTFTGCVTYDMSFRNDKGQVANCNGHGLMLGAISAQLHKKECIEKMEKKGFKKQN